jgi:hypothetical protein
MGDAGTMLVSPRIGQGYGYARRDIQLNYRGLRLIAIFPLHEIREIWALLFGKYSCVKLQFFATIGYVSLWTVFTGLVGGWVRQ